MTPISHHIFLFPFRWEGKEGEAISLDKCTELLSSNWIPSGELFDEEADHETYNEYTYFYDYVRAVLYDDSSSDNRRFPNKRKSNLIQHYAFNTLKKRDQSGAYVIRVKNGIIYRLKLTDILLNLYETGVGVLSYHLQNENYRNESDILKINDFGRRLYPQFLGGGDFPLTGPQHTFLAESIYLYTNGTTLSETFDAYRKFATPKVVCYPTASRVWSRTGTLQANPIKLPKHITGLFPEQWKVATRIKPILDDRMFVVCWYGDNILARLSKSYDFHSDHKPKIQHPNAYDFWSKYLFVDNKHKGLDNPDFEHELLKKHTYTRWQQSGTLFGISRYSFVCLTDREGFALNALRPHIYTMYYRMAELALVQRASVVAFSERVTRLSNLDDSTPERETAEGIRTLYRDYIRFVNKIYFREVTPQEQGIELYNMLQTHMRLPEQVKELDQEIEELHRFANMLEEKRRNDVLDVLTFIGGAFTVLSLFIGIFSVEQIKKTDVVKNMGAGDFGLLMLGIILLITLVGFIFKKNRKKANKVQPAIILSILSLPIIRAFTKL